MEFKVPDMACSACANTITEAVTKLDANAEVKADLDSKLVAIETQKPEDDVKKAIVEAGYTIDG